MDGPNHLRLCSNGLFPTHVDALPPNGPTHLGFVDCAAGRSHTAPAVSSPVRPSRHLAFPPPSRLRVPLPCVSIAFAAKTPPFLAAQHQRDDQLCPTYLTCHLFGCNALPCGRQAAGHLRCTLQVRHCLSQSFCCLSPTFCRQLRCLAPSVDRLVTAAECAALKMLFASEHTRHLAKKARHAGEETPHFT